MPVVRTIKMSRRLKYFSNRLCQSLSLVSNNCNSSVINGWMYRLGKVPKLNPTFLVFISKLNSKCKWISVTISSGTVTGVQSIIPKAHVACICMEYLRRNGTALRAPDVENNIPLKNLSGTSHNSDSPSPPSSNTPLFSNFHLVTNSISLSFCHQLPLCFIFSYEVR
jgi:hypothetical protein